MVNDSALGTDPPVALFAPSTLPFNDGDIVTMFVDARDEVVEVTVVATVMVGLNTP